MAEKSSDPIAAWRDMLGEWEKGINSAANKAMEKDDFAKMMGAFTGAGSSAQSAFGDLMQRYLTTLNLPSRTELAAIGERLQAIEGQLSQLMRMMRSMPGVAGSAQVATAKPARTRQPPGASVPPKRDNNRSETTKSGQAKSGGTKGDLL